MDRREVGFRSDADRGGAVVGHLRLRVRLARRFAAFRGRGFRRSRGLRFHDRTGGELSRHRSGSRACPPSQRRRHARRPTNVRHRCVARRDRGCGIFVVARLLDPRMTFDVPSGTTLGGCPVQRWLEMPRAVDANGRQRQDLFGFCRTSVADLSRMRTGERVVLVQPSTPR